jgi:hypothetical protein
MGYLHGVGVESVMVVDAVSSGRLMLRLLQSSLLVRVSRYRGFDSLKHIRGASSVRQAVLGTVKDYVR